MKRKSKLIGLIISTALSTLMLTSVAMAAKKVDATTITNERIAASSIAETKSGKIYIADSRFDCIYTLTGESKLTVEISKGIDGVQGICAFKKGIAIADTLNNAVKYYNGKKAKKIANVTDPVAVTSNGKSTLYVLSRKKGEIIVVSGKKTKTLSTDIKLSEPEGMVFYKNKLYIADSGNNRIVEVSLDGKSKIVAGSKDGEEGDSVGKATEARFSSPTGIAVDGKTLYVADTGNSSIKTISLKNGKVSEYISGYSLNNGLSPAEPTGLCITKKGLFIGDIFTMEVIKAK